jgi:hypothetical protein
MRAPRRRVAPDAALLMKTNSNVVGVNQDQEFDVQLAILALTGAPKRHCERATRFNNSGMDWGADRVRRILRSHLRTARHFKLEF